MNDLPVYEDPNVAPVKPGARIVREATMRFERVYIPNLGWRWRALRDDEPAA